MPKLTDDELAELLRETFADKEDLADSLPVATKRRHRVAPALLAAAAVLAVIAGVLVAADGLRRHDPAARPGTGSSDTAQPETRRTRSGEDGAVWAAAIATLTRNLRPRSESLMEVQVHAELIQFVGAVTPPASSVDRSPSPGARSPSPGADPESLMAPPGPVFSAADRALIEQAVRPFASVRWDGPVELNCVSSQGATLTVGSVVTRGSRRDVPLVLRDGCDTPAAGIYVLQLIDGAWQVTSSTGTLPCVKQRTSEANPRVAC
ncbi:hypothetical protein [Kribbella solani]|uniref:Uncharacterized protein n=1 Tax=Kribbella solani TaxID=236067 RepID=A0A841DTQ8_9ACTN|nr:hypothetical protein [Kribbella solani]MBB5981429.1 hypothetical protein [Kribbella solani]